MLRVATALLLLASLGGCSSRRSFGDLVLPTLAGTEEVALAKCPTPKCLTIVVAPWCGYCRTATGLIRALREHLRGRNVATRVVVGMDGLDAVRDYAREFGPDTLLDGAGRLRVNGVPHFLVSDAAGVIGGDVAGIAALPPPWGADELASIAAQYGLP